MAIPEYRHPITRQEKVMVWNVVRSIKARHALGNAWRRMQRRFDAPLDEAMPQTLLYNQAIRTYRRLWVLACYSDFDC